MATPATTSAATAADTSADTTSADTTSAATAADTAADTAAAAIATVDSSDTSTRNVDALIQQHHKLLTEYQEVVQQYARRAYNSAEEYRLSEQNSMNLFNKIVEGDARHKKEMNYQRIESVLGPRDKPVDTRLQDFDRTQLRQECEKTFVTSSLPQLKKFALDLLEESIRVLVERDGFVSYDTMEEIKEFISEVKRWLANGANDPMPTVSGKTKYNKLRNYVSHFESGYVSHGRPYSLLSSLQKNIKAMNDSGDTKERRTKCFDKLKRVMTEITVVKQLSGGSLFTAQLTVFDTVMGLLSERLVHDKDKLYRSMRSMAEQHSTSSDASGTNTTAPYNDPCHEYNQSMFKLVSADDSSKDKELMVQVVQNKMRYRSTTSNEKYRDKELVSLDESLKKNEVQRALCVEALKTEIDQLEAQDTDSQTNIADLAERIHCLDRTDQISHLINEANQILGVDLSNEQSLLGDVTTSAHLCQKLDVIRDPQNKEKYFAMTFSGQPNPDVQQMRAVVMIAKALERVQPGETAQFQVRDAVFLDHERRDFEMARQESEGWLTRAKNWLLTLGRAPQRSRSNDARPLVDTMKSDYQQAIRRPASVSRLRGWLSSAWKYITRSGAARFRHENRYQASGTGEIQLVESDILRSLKQFRLAQEAEIKDRRPRLNALIMQRESLKSCGDFAAISEDTVTRSVTSVIKEQQQRKKEQKCQKIHVQVAQKVRQLTTDVGVVEDMFNDPDESEVQSLLGDFESESSFFFQLKRDNDTLKTEIKNLIDAQPEISKRINKENDEVKRIESRLNQLEQQLHNNKAQKQHQEASCRQRLNELREQLTQHEERSIDCLDGLKENIESCWATAQSQFAVTTELGSQYSNLLDDIKQEYHKAYRQRLNELREQLTQHEERNIDCLDGLKENIESYWATAQSQFAVTTELGSQYSNLLDDIKQQYHEAYRQRFNELRKQLTQPGERSIDCLDGLKELHKRIESCWTETQSQFAAVSTSATSKLELQYSKLLDDINKEQHEACRQRLQEFGQKFQEFGQKFDECGGKRVETIGSLNSLLKEVETFTKTNEVILQDARPVPPCMHLGVNSEGPTAYRVISEADRRGDGFKIQPPSASDNLKSKFDALLRKITQKRAELMPPPAPAKRLSGNPHGLLVGSSAANSVEKSQGSVAPRAASSAAEDAPPAVDASPPLVIRCINGYDESYCLETIRGFHDTRKGVKTEAYDAESEGFRPPTRAVSP